MMKWENPKIQGISLKETETTGVTHVDCGHTRDDGTTKIDCWQCNCCKIIYHATGPSQAESDAAKALAQECYLRNIADGQCS